MRFEPKVDIRLSQVDQAGHIELQTGIVVGMELAGADECTKTITVSHYPAEEGGSALNPDLREVRKDPLPSDPCLERGMVDGERPLRADQQKVYWLRGPDGALGENRPEGPNDQAKHFRGQLIGLHPLAHDPIIAQPVPAQLPELAREEVPDSGHPGIGGLAGDDIIDPVRERYVIAAIADHDASLRIAKAMVVELAKKTLRGVRHFR